MLILSNYFLEEAQDKSLSFSSRLSTHRISTSIVGLGMAHVSVGDIITLVFWKEAIIYRFEGICIAIKKKALQNIDSSLCIRNVIFGIGIEIQASYFLNRIYFLTVLDYKRKQFLYRKSKLFYLRYKLNRSSRVK